MILDIGILLFEKNEESLRAATSVHQQRATYKALIESATYEEETANLVMPFCTETKYDFLKNSEWNKLSMTNDLKLLWRYEWYRHAIRPLKDYFFLQPSIFFTGDEFQRIDNQSLVKEFYYKDELSFFTSRVEGLNPLYDTYLLAPRYNDKFLEQIRIKELRPPLLKILNEFDPSNTIALQKII